MGDVIDAAAERPAAPGVDARRRSAAHAIGIVGCRPRGRLPGLEAHAGHRLADDARRTSSAACAPLQVIDMAPGDQARAPSPAAARPRNRRSARCRRRRLPRPARARARAPGAASSSTPPCSIRPSTGKRNSRCASNHSGSKAIAGPRQIGEHALEILPDEMRQHEAVMQRRAPAHQAALLRLAPEPGDQRAEQQLLGQAHARVGRHFERAELDQAEPAGRPVGRIELVDADLGAMGVAGDVDQQIAEQPVDQPGRRRSPRRAPARLRERDLEFVELSCAPRRSAAPGWSGR